MKTAYCLFRDQFHHILPVEKASEGRIEFIYDSEWEPNKIRQLKPDIIIGINEYHLQIAKCYEMAHQLNIPTLTIQDGILEWRYLFENPMFSINDSGVPLHQPIIADKYACIGPWWAHLISALGNQGKVEITGMPKMDAVENQTLTFNENRSKNKRILIITAAKPYFNESQKQIVIKMLNDLNMYFEKRNDIEVVWRITKLLDKEIDVQGSFGQKDSIELQEQLKNCDAVISTVSTAMIESLLIGKPLARIDYFNTPTIFPTVWNITHIDQIDREVNSLLSPTKEQCVFQELFKQQVIGYIGNASGRVVDLMLSMIDFKKESPGMKLPSNILNCVSSNSATMPLRNSMQLLYSEREVIHQQDTSWLKAKLVRLEWENHTLKRQISKMSFGKLLQILYNKMFKI